MDSFEELKLLLEGKTIFKIEDPAVPEAICKFTLTDGSAFRLHATDLGFWIEKTNGSSGYKSLDDLIRDYGHHIYNLMPQFNYDPPSPLFSTNKNMLIFTAPDNKIYEIDKQYLNVTEINIINHKKALKTLLAAFCLGDMWKIDFSPKNAAQKLPKNCHIEIKNGK